MKSLEVFVNDPFDGSLLKDLFISETDLKLANPHASFPYRPEEWLNTISKHPDNCSLIFKQDQNIVGQTTILVKEEDIFLCFVILHPEFRGKNLAPEMILKTEEFCRLNYPHHEIYLNVNKKNDRAKKLYLKLGYEVSQEQDDRFQMKKSLIRK